jgi:hypothetical protein
VNGQSREPYSGPVEAGHKPCFERVPGFVWRLAGDRVLVRSVGARGDHAITELTGDVMLVWVALDEPGTAAEVAARLGAPTQSDVDAAVLVGVEAGVLRATDQPGGE